MRKGLVVTLGVALALSVAPGFAEAPIISCLPDIIITDYDVVGQTADTNLFIFSDALDLDEYVQDFDTADSVLRWSFIETTGDGFRINGLTEVAPGQVLEPGVNNINNRNGLITLENTATVASSMTSTLEFYVSDGSATRSESVVVTTINVTPAAGSQMDAIVSPNLRRFTFEAGQEGWIWFDLQGAGYVVPSHSLAGGALQIAKTAAATNVVFGGYESSKVPGEAIQPKLGCIARAKFMLRGQSTTSQAMPGFRLQAVTTHMAYSGGQWVPNIMSQDYVDTQKVVWDTMNFFHIAGREPGATAKPYTMLSYPFQAAETFLSTDTVTYFTCDMLDVNPGDNDLGTLFIDEVTIDAIDRPELGAGTVVDAFTTTSFATASWLNGKKALDATKYNDTNLVTANQSGALVITVATGNAWFEAYHQLTRTVPVQAGNWYRLNWQISMTEQPGDYFGPRVRVGLVSERFVWIAHKDLDGGGLVARFESTPKDFELWCVAPSELGTTPGLTEPMTPIFESWLADNNTNFPFYKNVAGTVRAVALTTEVFDAIP